MYEEVSFKERFKLLPALKIKRSYKVNCKSLIIKLLILIFIVFILCFIIFKPQKASLDKNIKMIKIASISYFQVNQKKDFVKLNKLYIDDYIDMQYDTSGNKCNPQESYSELINNDDNTYDLKIYLKCGRNTQTKIYSISKKIIGRQAEASVTTNVEDGEYNFSDEKLPNGKYKHIKYGAWHVGKALGNNVEISSAKTDIYKFCKNNKCIEDSIANYKKYQNYTLEYIRTDEIPMYRLIFVVWSNAESVEGYTNTGIIEYN